MKFFHGSTDGSHNSVIYKTSKDFKQATIIMALLAIKYNVRIICFCHMSSHSHFLLLCESLDVARSFMNSFKRDYAHYLHTEHGINKAYENIACEPKAIEDIWHLKNCIAYILNNPVTAKIVRNAEEYEHSSFNAYFSLAPITGHPVQKCSLRWIRSCLRTRFDLRNSNYVVNDNGDLEIRYIVDYEFVEKLYGTKAEFYKSLAITDSVAMEMEYGNKIIKFNDNELLNEAIAISREKYCKNSILSLTKSEKISLITPLVRKTYASPQRLARILRLEATEVAAILGIPNVNR